jgi:hypothetical protein
VASIKFLHFLRLKNFRWLGSLTYLIKLKGDHMATALREPSSTNPLPFERYVSFGMYPTNSFPVDTATEFGILPIRATGKSNKTCYRVEVRFNTFRNEQPYGWGDFIFETEDIGKANGLIKQLVEHHIGFRGCPKEVHKSLQDRVVHLTFERGWAGTYVHENGSLQTLSQRDVFRGFSGPSGPLWLYSEDYELSIPQDDLENGTRLDLKFNLNLAQDQLENAMNSVIQKLKSMRPCQERMKDQGDLTEVIETMTTVRINDQETCLHNENSRRLENERTPIVVITETEMTKRNRHGGEETPLKLKEIPLLIRA